MHLADETNIRFRHIHSANSQDTDGFQVANLLGVERNYQFYDCKASGMSGAGSDGFNFAGNNDVNIGMMFCVATDCTKNVV